MKETSLLLSGLVLLAVLASCSRDNGMVEAFWTGEDIASTWTYAHQDTSTIKAFHADKGILYITTRANTMDRPKMFAPQIYTDGEYTWKTCVPEVAPGDRTSVGSWIYCDDHHEIDFECGWGNDEARAAVGAGEGDLVACMTNQDFPFTSTYARISPGWHEFGITLDLVEGNYFVHWIIDGVEQKTLQTGFGPDDAIFRIFVSVENLMFIGTHIASQDNTGAYEWVKFKGHTIEK